MIILSLLFKAYGLHFIFHKISLFYQSANFSNIKAQILKLLLLTQKCFNRIDRTFKMYYGGKQARPDAPYCRPVLSPNGTVIAHVGEGTRKDIRNAVEAAHAAAPG